MPRARKPLDVHALAGTRPEYVPDEQLAASRPKFPKGISGEAKKAFKRLVAMLQERRHLTNADGELLGLYATTFDRHRRAMEKLAQEGEVRIYVRLDSNGQPRDQEKVNLWLGIAESSEKTMLACLDRLGLTPLNRSKVQATSAPKTKELKPGSAAWVMAQPRVEVPAPPDEESEGVTEEMLENIQ